MLAYMEIIYYLCNRKKGNMLISQPYRSTVKRLHMKNINITKSQAISVIGNLLREGCAIPMASIGNGGAGLSYVQYVNYDEVVSWLKGMGGFRIVPTSEVSDEFSEMLFDVYDVCVEFTNNDGDYSEQFLLWDIDLFKD